MAETLNVRQVVTILRDRLASLLGITHGGARDLYANFGWDKNLVIEQLFAMYYRGGLANRICTAYPAATWRDPPVVRDEAGSSPDEGADDYSPFTERVEELFKRHDVLSYLERVDRVAGVGRFGVLLMGFRDGLPLDQPLAEGNYPLLYLSVYSDPNVTINEWETSEQDPRYGKPKTYTLQTGNPVVGGGQAPTPHRSHRVHWSRVIHVAERLDEDETFGIPRLMPVYNDLQDLVKTLGAGAETYWFNSRGGMVWSADKDANFSQVELARMERQAEEFANQLRRITALQGVTATQLTSTITDPGPFLDKMLDVISGTTGIPKRILIGSERGELSSDQDENNWAQRVEERRTNYAGPKVLKPVISKLILTGNVPQPEGQWEIQWPGQGLGPQKAAEVGFTRSNTLRNYVTSPGADVIVPPEEFRKEFLGLDPVSEYDAELDEEPLDETLLELPPAEGPSDPGVENAAVGFGDQMKRPGALLRLNRRELHVFRTSQFGREFLKANKLLRSLYVCRPVINAGELKAWAHEQGFTTLLGEDDLHVTLAYCRSSVDWFAIPTPWSENEDGEVLVKPGGARYVKELGDEGAIVLCFKSDLLEARHREIEQAGASWPHPEYQPHVTLTYDLDGLDLAEVEPYRGRLVLGPEEFREVDAEFRERLIEVET